MSNETAASGFARMNGGMVEVSARLPMMRQPVIPPESMFASQSKASAGDGTDRPTHAAGFESVCWYGTVYTFTPKQRSVVAALWQAWEQGYRWMDQAALMELAESDQSRLRGLFDHGRHPAWGTLVVQAQIHGGPTGSYGLTPVVGR